MVNYNKLTSFGRIFTIYASTRLQKQASYVRKGLFLEYDSTHNNEELSCVESSFNKQWGDYRYVVMSLPWAGN